MTKLDVSTWGEFFVGGPNGLFHGIDFGKCKSSGTLLDGDIPYIGASNRNNGVMRYVADDSPSMVSKGNCIVFICNGQGSGGYTVYTPDDFIGSRDIKVGYNDHLNLYTGTFLVTVLNRNRDIYGYGFTEKRTKAAMAKEVVRLPVTSSGEPDWGFMEAFMREKMDEAESRFSSLRRVL